MVKLRQFFGVCCLCWFAVFADAETQYYNGTVVDVADGDTATVQLKSGELKRIRFYGVDSPETEWPDKWPAQPYGPEAKAFMVALIQGKSVTVRLKGERAGSREVGEIFVNGRSASRELLRAGLAWWNKKYEPDDLDLKRLQQAAKRKQLGLWAERKPEPPWKFRRRHSR